MSEVARTRAYSSRVLASNSANQTEVERSRERRRRRIEMRRSSGGPVSDDGDVLSLRQDGGGSGSDEISAPEGSTVIGIPVTAACFSWEPGNGGLVIRGSVPRLLPPPPPRQLQMPAAAPVVGAVSVAGRQRLMEDAVTIKTNLCSPLINRRLPVHYFGVFDGHGGSHFAIMCKENLHTILKEELMGVPPGGNHIGPTSRPPPPPPPGLISDESTLQETWRILISRVYARTETVSLHTCVNCGSMGSQCGCPEGDVLFTGTTAVAVVLTEKHIVAGNCGDSRAVLYRAGRIIPLTFDHKPDRADEKTRIQASGGRVIYADTPRVEGILAMSRAIGDMYLKPYVISEPDVTFTRRDDDDEFLIIATDGLWDVVSTDMAGRVARECLREPRAGGGAQGRVSNFLPPRNGRVRLPSRSASAASLLTRLAMARRSTDNISVVVVDLKRGVSRGAGN